MTRDTRPEDGARPWSRRLRPSHLNRRHTGNSALRAGAVVAGERQEGKGRGDAVRLSAGISSKGSNPASRGSIVARWPSARRPVRKRGGPQDRQRDATSPRLAKRRKPSRWCETTRAERDFGGWYLRGRSADWPSVWELTLGEHVDGGATGALQVHVAGIADETQERRSFRPGRSVQLRRGVKVRRFARQRLSGQCWATGSAEHLEGQPGNGQGRGGGGEHQPTATQDRSGAPPFVAR